MPSADIRLAQREPALTRLRTGIRHLSPGYFALVMATGIVSVAVGSGGAAGLSVVLWAFGTWLIPLLAGLGVWRHLIRRIPLRYGPALWSIVFPLGMYCVASERSEPRCTCTGWWRSATTGPGSPSRPGRSCSPRC